MQKKCYQSKKVNLLPCADNGLFGCCLDKVDELPGAGVRDLLLGRKDEAEYDAMLLLSLGSRRLLLFREVSTVFAGSRTFEEDLCLEELFPANQNIIKIKVFKPSKTLYSVM